MTVEKVKDSDSVVQATRRRDLPLSVWSLVLARAVNRLGAFTLSFLTIVLVDELKASVAAAGWAMAAFGLATIPSRLAGGRWADRLGRVPTICLGLVGCAGAQLWVAGSPTFPVALVGVILLGLSFELYEPPSQALVADLTTDEQRPLAYGLVSAALAAAGAGAGLLAVMLGALDLRWLLVADAATCLVTAVIVAVVVRDPGAPVTRGDQAAPADPWRDRRLLAMLAAGTGFALVYMTIVIALPLAMSARGLAPERAGLVLAVCAVTVVAAQPVLRCRLLVGDGFRALAIGYVVLAAGLVAAAAASSVLTLLVAAVVWSVGDLLLMGHAWTIVSRLAPSGSRGSYLAAYGLSWGVATVAAPVLGTQLLAHGGPVGLWLTLAGAAFLLALAQPALARQCRASPSYAAAPD
ncbi:MAG: MFS transporter [Nocardioides sp.]